MARDKRGRFVKKGAMVRYRTRTLTKYRTRSAPTRRVRRRRSSGGFGGLGGDLPVKEAAAAVAVGFLLQASPAAGSTVAKVQEQMNKLPSIGNRTITAGIALHYANKFTIRNRWASLGAKMLIIGGAFQFGRAKMEVSQALLGSWDDAMDADEIAGTISDADIEE